MVKISIIIPTFNEEKYLPRLLESIKKQTFNDYEIIVADNNSKDKTKDIAKKFKCKIFKGGLPGKARNNGARVAKGDLLVFLDADGELLDDDFLANLNEELSSKKIDICTSRYIPLSNSFFYKFLYSFNNSLLCFMQSFYPMASGYFIAIRKNIHEKIEGFDESIFVWEDDDYVKRASKLGKFKVLTRLRTGVSTRRFEKDKFYILKLFFTFFRRLFFGEIKKPIYKYDFGKHI